MYMCASIGMHMPACKMKVACWRDVILLVVLLLLPQIGLARTGDLESGLGRHEYGMLLDWIRDLGEGCMGRLHSQYMEWEQAWLPAWISRLTNPCEHLVHH